MKTKTTINVTFQNNYWRDAYVASLRKKLPKGTLVVKNDDAHSSAIISTTADINEFQSAFYISVGSHAVSFASPTDDSFCGIHHILNSTSASPFRLPDFSDRKKFIADHEEWKKKVDALVEYGKSMFIPTWKDYDSTLEQIQNISNQLGIYGIDEELIKITFDMIGNKNNKVIDTYYIDDEIEVFACRKDTKALVKNAIKKFFSETDWRPNEVFVSSNGSIYYWDDEVLPSIIN